MLITGGILRASTDNIILGVAIGIPGSIPALAASLTSQQTKSAYQKVDRTNQKLLGSGAMKQALLSSDDTQKEAAIKRSLDVVVKEYGVFVNEAS